MKAKLLTPNRIFWPAIVRSRKDLAKNIFTGLAFLTFVAGCGNNSRQNTTPHPIVQNPAPLPGVANPMTGLTGVGFYAQTPNFFLPGYTNNGSSFQVQGGMAAILKEAMGVCDRERISGGLANCQTWLTGAFDLVLYAPQGSTAESIRIIVRAVPGSQLGGYGWYYYSLPHFTEFIGCLIGMCYPNPQGVFNPLVLDATLWPINNSQGFEARSYGPRLSTAYNKLFQLQVFQGKLEDAQFDFVLRFNGSAAASGRAVRCQSAFCGLNSSYFRFGQ